MSVKWNRNFKELTYALEKRQKSRPDVSGLHEDGSGAGDTEMETEEEFSPRSV